MRYSTLYSRNRCNFACKYRKSLKLHRFKSFRNLVSLLIQNFFCFVCYQYYFAASGLFLYNLLLNFTQKCGSCSYEINCSRFCSKNLKKLLLQNFQNLHQKQRQQNSLVTVSEKDFALKLAKTQKSSYDVNFRQSLNSGFSV